MAKICVGTVWSRVNDFNYGFLPSADLDVQLRLMRQAGIKYFRDDLMFSKILGGASGVVNEAGLAGYDNIVNRALEYDIHMIGLIDQYNWYTPDWAVQPGYTAGNRLSSPAAYAELCTTLAEHFDGRITIWELGNEPDLTVFTAWVPLSRLNYVNWYLKTGYNAIKAVNPNNIVLNAGWDSGTGIVNNVSEMYAAGGKDYFDGLAFHPYDDQKGDPTAGLNGSSLKIVENVRNVMIANGDSAKKVYLTEMGWPTHPTQGVSEANQALYISKLFKALETPAYNYVELASIHQLVNAEKGDHNESHFGLVYGPLDATPYVPKPAYAVIKGMTGAGSPLPSYFLNYIPSAHLYHDTFSRANGALGAMNTGQAWLGSTWSIVSSVAKNNPTLGSELVANGDFTTNTNGWNAVNATLDSIAGFNGNSLQVTNSGVNNGYAHQAITTVVGQWYRVEILFKDGTTSALCLGGTAPGDGSYFNAGFPTATPNGLAFYFRANTTTTYISLKTGSNAPGATALFDSVTCMQITFNKTMATVNTGMPNVNISVSPRAIQFQNIGLILNADSQTDPQNFVLATHNGYTQQLNLTKCVNGVYTSIYFVNVTNVTGAKVGCVKNGDSYQLYYNGILRGSAQIIDDAEIVDNTIHGMFALDATATMDNFYIDEVFE